MSTTRSANSGERPGRRIPHHARSVHCRRRRGLAGHRAARLSGASRNGAARRAHSSALVSRSTSAVRWGQTTRTPSPMSRPTPRGWNHSRHHRGTDRKRHSPHRGDPPAGGPRPEHPRRRHQLPCRHPPAPAQLQRSHAAPDQAALPGLVRDRRQRPGQAGSARGNPRDLRVSRRRDRAMRPAVHSGGAVVEFRSRDATALPLFVQHRALLEREGGEVSPPKIRSLTEDGNGRNS
jgi:hypothetical protein